MSPKSLNAGKLPTEQKHIEQWCTWETHFIGLSYWCLRLQHIASISPSLHFLVSLLFILKYLTLHISRKLFSSFLFLCYAHFLLLQGWVRLLLFELPWYLVPFSIIEQPYPILLICLCIFCLLCTPWGQRFLLVKFRCQHHAQGLGNWSSQHINFKSPTISQRRHLDRVGRHGN